MIVTNNTSVARVLHYKVNGQRKSVSIPGGQSITLLDLQSHSQVLHNNYDLKLHHLNEGIGRRGVDLKIEEGWAGDLEYSSSYTGRYLNITDGILSLGSVDESNYSLHNVLQFTRSDVTTLEQTVNSNRKYTMRLKGVRDYYNTLIEVDEIVGSANHYSKVYKSGSTPYSSLLEIIELFTGVKEEMIAPIAHGGDQSSDNGLILTLDVASNSIVRDCQFYHSFTPTYDGGYPKYVRFALLDGFLYGTTSQHGALSSDTHGNIFKINTTTNDYSNVIGFTHSTQEVFYGLLKHSNGNIYGTTNSGGVNEAGSIFIFNPSTLAITNLVSFGGVDECYNPGPLFEASDGNLYLASFNFSNSYGVLVKYNISTSAATIIHQFNDSDGAFYDYNTTLSEKNGKLYGTTQFNDTSVGTIFEYDLSSSTFTSKVVFSATTTGTRPYAGLTLASNGKFYGTTTVDTPQIFEYDPDTNVLVGKQVITNIVHSELIDVGGFLYGQYTNGAILKYDYNSNILTGATFSALTSKSAALCYSPLVFANGNFYATCDSTSSQYSHGMVYKINTGLTNVTIIHEFIVNISAPAWAGPKTPMAGVMKASNNVIYGTSNKNGSGDIYKYDRVLNTATTLYNLGSIGYFTASVPTEVGNELWIGTVVTTSNQNSGNITAILKESPYTFREVFHAQVYDIATMTGTGVGHLGSVTLGGDGYAYLTTKQRSYNDYSSMSGALYRYNISASTAHTLHAFLSGDPNGVSLDNTPLKIGNNLYFGTGSFWGGASDQALVKYDLSTSALTRLSTEEGAASGDPILASDGNLYGISSRNGANGYGYIYKYDLTAETFYNVYNFTTSTGYQSSGRFAEASNGVLYGIHPMGGTYNKGTIFTYNIYTGVFTKIHNFDGGVYGTPIGSSYRIDYNHQSFMRVAPTSGFLTT